MSDMVQVAVAEDITRGGGDPAILEAAGIDVGARAGRRAPPGGDRGRPAEGARPGASLEAAQHAIEAMTDPDELVGDA